MSDARPSHELAELLRQGYRYAYALTHHRERAEDLLQDAWLAILRADGPRQLPYLRTTIKNHFINQYRRDQIAPLVSLENTDLQEEQSADPSHDDVLADAALLDSALRKLRPVEREVIYLSAIEGYTAKEISDCIDKPRGTVLSLLHRAKVKLRAYFCPQQREVK